MEVGQEVKGVTAMDRVRKGVERGWDGEAKAIVLYVLKIKQENTNDSSSS